MELYLVQHGVATPKEEDPERPLTTAGRDTAERVARAAAEGGVAAHRVYHSGKLRASQTAEIFAAHLATHRATTAIDGIAPNDDPARLRDRLSELGESAMLVGHLPFLSRLASLLLVGDPTREPIAFQNAGIVCLREDEAGGWQVRWVLTPEIIARES